MKWLQCVACLLLLSVAVLLKKFAPTMTLFSYRLARNAFLPGVPDPMPAKYADTSDAELVEKLTVVIGAKDFISQTAEQIDFLGTLNWPTHLRVIVSYSSTVGWESIEGDVNRAVANSPLKNLTMVDAGPFANPFTAWREAVELATTPDILLMHSDMYPLEGRQFLTELYEAGKAHPEYGVIAPELYEAETEGYLCHHTTQTNLHMREHEDGTLFLGHDGDIIEGTNHHVNDFVERAQPDFLEDHAFIIRKPLVNAIVDPEAAYTMEYLDMAIALRSLNTSIWYVPSSRVEYRVWHNKLRWQDATFFAYRRSERLARQTKEYLTNKWGVEFPNTGFSNFVKFSVVRGSFWTQAAGTLPSTWKEMASMYYAWFEIAGFNYFGSSDKLLPEFLETFDENLTMPGRASRHFPQFVPAKPAPASGVDIKNVLPIRKKTDFFETDLPTALLSTGVAKFSTKGSCETPGVLQTLRPFCGMMIEESTPTTSCTCWLYIAPYGYDSALYHGMESVLRFFNLPERVAVYAALKLENEDLFQSKAEFEELMSSLDTEVYMSVCGPGDDTSATCNVQMDGFSHAAKLVQWSFRLNNWSAIKSALRPSRFQWFTPNTMGLALLAALTMWFRQTGKAPLTGLAQGASCARS
jgi:hypothetical protein